MQTHSVHKLFQQRMAQVTKPFKARGADVARCPQCRINQQFCMCPLRPEPLDTQAGFLLLYYDDEVLKPSNTGKLIADLCLDTYAYLWQRTGVEPSVIELLNDPNWYPIVVFPDEYADKGRGQVTSGQHIPEGHRPLFVMLDGSWREAKKMFRKSPYLDRFPVFSMTPEQTSVYQVRKAAREYQLATAEVASGALAMLGETQQADIMHCWFEVFSYQYQKGVMRPNSGNPDALNRLTKLIATHDSGFL
jgi:DTW domain-containing protein